MVGASDPVHLLSDNVGIRRVVRTHHNTGAKLVQTASVYLNEENPLRLSHQFSIYTQNHLSTHIYRLHSYSYISMSAQETTKDGGNGGNDGGEPKGPGACTVQGCVCPAFVGNQSYCNRQGCGHASSHRKISDT
jgi:hypothetical protein